MSSKHREQGQVAKVLNRDGRQPDGSAPERTVPDSRPAPDRFRPNVFTWTGPGIENIFIDIETTGYQRVKRLPAGALLNNTLRGTDEIPTVVGAGRTSCSVNPALALRHSVRPVPRQD